MKPNHFVLLAATAAASTALALVAYYSSSLDRVGGQAAKTPLVPALKGDAAKLAKISIAQSGTEVVLESKDNRWLLASQEGYPANLESVRKLVTAATEAEIVEKKTAKKDLHKMLGVDDPKEKGSNARQIKFMDQSGGIISEFVAGRTKNDAFGAGKGGSYVRRAGEDQTWLASRDLGASVSMRDWVKTKLIDISPPNVKAVQLTVESDQPYSIVKSKDGRNHELAQTPQGKKLKLVNSIDDIVEAVSLIEFKNVRKAGKAASLPLAGVAEIEDSKGFKAKVEMRADKERTQVWATFSSTGEGEGKKLSDELNALTQGWEFELPATELEADFKKLSDLLEDQPS